MASGTHGIPQPLCSPPGGSRSRSMSRCLSQATAVTTEDHISFCGPTGHNGSERRLHDQRRGRVVEVDFYARVCHAFPLERREVRWSASPFVVSPGSRSRSPHVARPLPVNYALAVTIQTVLASPFCFIRLLRGADPRSHSTCVRCASRPARGGTTHGDDRPGPELCSTRGRTRGGAPIRAPAPLTHPGPSRRRYRHQPCGRAAGAHDHERGDIAAMRDIAMEL
jgi:hypothetical protein